MSAKRTPQDRLRLHDLLEKTLASERQPPLPVQAWNNLHAIVGELGEAFAEAQHQAAFLSLDSAGELAELRQRFTAIRVDFLIHARQRAICHGKPLLGFCGGFSTGKSTLLNYLVGRSDDELLPTKATPDTALPAFLLHSPRGDLWIESRRGTAHETGRLEDLQLFRHSEAEAFEPWKHLIKCLYALSPEVDQEKVAYLDLPGHTSGADDLKISLEAARHCDAIVYLIEVAQGDVKPTDIDFLLALEGLHPPIFVVLTKCDLLPPSQRTAVLEQTRATLRGHGIAFEGPALWSIDEGSLRRTCREQIRSYTGQLSARVKDRWLAEVEKLASRLADLTASHHRHVKTHQAKPLQGLQTLARSQISAATFKKARDIAKESRYPSRYVDESFFGDTFQGNRFVKHFYGQADQWRTTSRKGFAGPINELALMAAYLCVIDAIDESGWHAALHTNNPSGSNDEWYYNRLKDITTTYSGIRAQIESIRKHVEVATRQPERSTSDLAERTQALGKRLVTSYRKLIVAAKKEDRKNGG